MKIKLAMPNGYGSAMDDRMAWEEAEGYANRLYLPIQDAAETAGLTYVKGSQDSTISGGIRSAVWEGTPGQIETCRMMLPVWAVDYTLIVEE